MGKTDYIGGRGEAIAFTRLTEFCRKNDGPYFLPHFLGEKCPTFDFLIELVGAGNQPLFFFVQVKATRAGYTRTDSSPRLKARVTADDVRRLSLCPAPTYIVAVDEEQERAFIIAIYGDMSDPISSVTTAHDLNCRTLERLWKEVRAFWKARSIQRKDSSFRNEVR